MERGLLTTKESSQKFHIDEEKLKYITSKVNIWDHFGISRSHYVSFDNDEELKIVKRFYMDLFQFILKVVSLIFLVLIVSGLTMSRSKAAKSVVWTYVLVLNFLKLKVFLLLSLKCKTFLTCYKRRRKNSLVSKIKKGSVSG